MDLEQQIRADNDRYKKMLIMYRSDQARTGELGPGGCPNDNAKEVERHLTISCG
jgi:hypothetical protein